VVVVGKEGRRKRRGGKTRRKGGKGKKEGKEGMGRIILINARGLTNAGAPPEPKRGLDPDQDSP
jgi:hypothetical protein